MTHDTITIPPGQTLEVRRVEQKISHTRFLATMPQGAELVDARVRGDAVHLTFLCDPTQKPDVLRLYLVPLNPEKQTPTAVLPLTLLHVFEVHPSLAPFGVWVERESEASAARKAA